MSKAGKFPKYYLSARLSQPEWPDSEQSLTSMASTVRAGSDVVRTDPLSFMAGHSKRRLNQALSVLSQLRFF